MGIVGDILTYGSGVMAVLFVAVLIWYGVSEWREHRPRRRE